MRAWCVAALLLTLAGCMASPMPADGCTGLRARAPTAVAPLAVLAGDPQDLAHRLAAALGDPVVAPGDEVTEGVHQWSTGNGSIGQTFTGKEHRLTYMSYHTESAWTVWDGSGMEADLRRVLDALGLDPAAYVWEGPVEGDFADSVAVYARQEGIRNGWWRVQVTYEDEPWDDGPPWQQVMMSGTLDAAAVPPLLPDDELRDIAERNARCDLQDQGGPPTLRVTATEVDATSFWMQGAPAKYVTVEVEECGGYYILDAASGAVLEGSVAAVCPYVET